VLVSTQAIENFVMDFQDSQDYNDCRCNVRISPTTSYFHNAYLHIQVSSNNIENKGPILPIPTDTAVDPLTSSTAVFDE